MMRKVLKARSAMLALVAVLAVLATPAAAQDVGDLILVKGSRSIEGSSVTSSGVFVPGSSVPVCFTATNDSWDLEYITSVALDFPAGWTVACATQDPQDSSGYNVTLQCSAAGNQLTYDRGNLVEGSWSFCATVTAPAGAPIPSDIQWSLDGDGLGDPPHSLAGQISMQPVELQSFSVN